ncbi:MAG: hypothetical protein ACOX69_09590 [Coriobacteriales bacterium]|jgi:AGZA family xanthine/uracil permease-like MFS transporter
MPSKKSKKAAPLDGFFHYVERGGSFSGEVAAGISMAALAVCGMFMNMQLVAQYLVTPYADSTMQQVAMNGEVYAMTWLASMLAAFIGTLLIGLVARLPLVQVTSLSLSCVLASTISLNSGLTYYNMLAVVFVADVLYLVVAAVPAIRGFIEKGVPAPVRAALPAAAGLLMAWIAAQLTGVFSVSSSVVPNYGTAANLGSSFAATSGVVPISSYSYVTDMYHPQMLLSGLAAVLALVVYAIGARRAKSPFTKALVIGTIFFLVASILFCGINWKNFKFGLSFLWARLWMVGSEDAMQAHVGAAISNLAIGKIFTEGFDFSGFTGNGGNVATLFATGVLSYLFLFMGDADSTLTSVPAVRPRRKVAANASADAAAGNAGAAASSAASVAASPSSSDSLAANPMLLNGVSNVVALALGSAPLALGKESVAGSRDGARSGLSAVVAAIVFLISGFVWVFPALLATITSYTISFNMYGHYGYTMQLLAQTSFSVADAVMVAVGLLMAARSFGSVAPDLTKSTTSVPFMATVAVTLLTTNLAAGIAAGCVGSVLVRATAPKRRKVQRKVGFVERVGGVETLVCAAVSCVVLLLIAL